MTISFSTSNWPVNLTKSYATKQAADDDSKQDAGASASSSASSSSVEAEFLKIARMSPEERVQAALLAKPQQSQFLGLLLLERGVLRAHQKVVTAQGDGEITSGTYSPTLQQSIALARLPKGVAIGESVKVQVRDKLLSAKVVKPCFVRNGKAMV